MPKLNSRSLYVWGSLFCLPLLVALLILSLPLCIFAIGAAYFLAWSIYLLEAQRDSKFNLPYDPIRVAKVNIALFHLILGWITDLPRIAAYLHWRYFEVQDTFRQLVSRNVEYSDAHSSCLLDVYHPERTIESKPPIIIFIHGGSWSSGSKLLYTPFANTLRELGYVVVVPDYRKYPQVKVDSIYDDVRQALLWTYANADEINGDREKIYLMGHSAGGHLCAQVILKNAIDVAKKQSIQEPLPRVKGLLLVAGVYSIERHLLTEQRRGVEKISAMTRVMGKTLENFRVNSPIDLVETNEELFVESDDLLKNIPRIMLVHGEKDTTVLSEQSVDMYNAFGQVLPPERRDDVDVRIRIHKRLKHAQCVTAFMPSLLGEDRLKKSLIKDIQEFVGNPHTEE
ncbi:Alpha/Beta hydrolase protein [Zychaea mexicana]|uniref:Alpha/Beta hydrolase protein n=1 Tax=Zychaea mexicana TaxID=64656 RepID=UPI0022FF0C3F|nr:Alpha/Beta hydrolase protein [Zychaea mexicana]KAI9485070.1 Alpha/Beta hydrolase protein [Zychaea mexicana]